MALVLDLSENVVYGHRILNLNREYALDEPPKTDGTPNSSETTEATVYPIEGTDPQRFDSSSFWIAAARSGTSSALEAGRQLIESRWFSNASPAG